MRRSIDAFSSDGQHFKLFEDGSWEATSTPVEGLVSFRDSRWGATQADVKERESSELLLEDSDTLLYKNRIADMEATILFTFVKGQLVMGQYLFSEPHANNQKYLMDFWRMKKILEEKYGASLESNVYWIDDLFRDDVDQWGLAVSRGDVSFFENWKADDTQIRLQLFGDNYEVRHSLIYSSISLEGLRESMQKQASMAGL